MDLLAFGLAFPALLISSSQLDLRLYKIKKENSTINEPITF